VNLIAVFVTIVLYMGLLPIIQQLSTDTVIQLNLNPTPYTSMTVALIYLIPFVMILSILMTALNYAIPKREGY
jgi:hypothetical protein